MKAVGGKRFCQLLEKRGWELRRIRGSHHIFVRTGYAVRISVPVHGNRPLKAGLQGHLMKLAGIDESEL
ncbi:MAG: type II toxin-antitoxin system HicA family toxin [Gammaproteobacteria bacterium]|nr:type II toxin-antitoxin system HicA family toxin [Gammaproteobacteria bacterium]